MINNEGYFDQFKSEPVPLLDFDEESFPFLLICGLTCLSIMNVKTGEHRPLINGSGIMIGYMGLTCLFVKREEYGQSIHWNVHLTKVDDSSQEGLIQYSYIALK